MGILADRDIRALCLDIDGTLYPRRMLLARMLRSSGPSLRLGFAFSSVRREYRRLQERRPPASEDREGLLDLQAHLVMRRLAVRDTEANLAKVRKRIDRQFYGAWEKSFLTVRPYPHVRETLSLCRSDGLKIGILSDFPIARKLETLRIADLADIAYSAEDTGYLKPHPKAFAPLLFGLGVPPSRILYMGDSYGKDIAGAREVGMQTCLITCNRKTFPKADFVVHSWKEFLDLIR